MKIINNINLDELRQEIKDLVPKSYFVNDIVVGYDSGTFYFSIFSVFSILWISGTILFDAFLIPFIVSGLFVLLSSFIFLLFLQKKRKKTILQSCENAKTEKDFIVLIEYLRLTYLERFHLHKLNFMSYAYNCIQSLSLADLFKNKQLLDVTSEKYRYYDEKSDVWTRYYKIPDAHQSISVTEPTLTLNNHGCLYRIPYQKEQKE